MKRDDAAVSSKRSQRTLVRRFRYAPKFLRFVCSGLRGRERGENRYPRRQVQPGANISWMYTIYRIDGGFVVSFFHLHGPVENMQQESVIIF